MANNLPAKSSTNFSAMIHTEAAKKRFEEILGKNAAGFASTLITLYKSNKQMQECDGASIMQAALTSAALDLPIVPSLGQAYIVPYNKQAQFQISAKGLLQLALRSNQYRAMHVGAVYEGQIKEIDFQTGEIVRGEKISNKVVGYIAYMKLVNGFEKTLYMTVEELQDYAATYSKSYAYDLRTNRKNSLWSTNFEAMAKKTVLKKLLREYGILSLNQQLATALQADQAVITEDEYIYVDNGGTVQQRDTIYTPELQDVDPFTADAGTGEVTEAVTNDSAETE